MKGDTSIYSYPLGFIIFNITNQSSKDPQRDEPSSLAISDSAFVTLITNN